MSFHDFLRDHRAGATHARLSDALREVVAAVIEEERAGKLVLTITVKPLAKGDGLEVTAKVDAQPPVPLPGTSIFFPTPEHNLTRADPRQQTMELREIGPAAAHKGIA